LVRILIFLLLTGALQTYAASFDDYLEDVRARAVAEGVSEETVDQVLLGLTVDERVIRFDRRQPEFVQTFEEYLDARVTDFRQEEGRRLLRQHARLLQTIADEYGVGAEYIVAFWGLETSFGRYQGKYSIIRSLATLGYDQRRSAFFTRELIFALKILDEKHISPEQFVGAWAGAMGQGQFMPSSFLRYAQDHDGDGRKDIWNSEADVFASIANYLREAGWKRGRGWGSRVELVEQDWSEIKPDSWDTTCRALRYHTRKMKPKAWADLGISSKSLNHDELYSLILPAEGDRTGYLVGGNFRAILNYNCANKYAVSVGLLADIIRSS
jgi:membrane-bound lytic murein transglycosylase B